MHSTMVLSCAKVCAEGAKAFVSTNEAYLRASWSALPSWHAGQSGRTTDTACSYEDGVGGYVVGNAPSSAWLDDDQV